MLTVHLRINDGGRPVPCLVRVEAGGVERPALGRPPGDAETAVGLADGRYAAIDGTCEVRLPPGPVRVAARRGPLYEPLDAVHPLAAGKMAMRFELTRRADWRPRGWYAGDCRVHGLTPHGALAQAAAADLAVVQLLVRGGESLVAFSGDRACVTSPETVVAVNTLNGDPALGSVSLLNAHRPVFPLTADEQPWSVYDWCDQCRRKKGLVVWPDLPGPHGETLAALVAEKVDAVEVCSAASLTRYHDVLNAGLWPALVGSSGRADASVALGAVRTYAQVEGPFSLTAWVEAVRARRTFVSSGPLLDFSVKRVGGVLRLRAEAVFAEHVEILANGEPIASRECEFEPTEQTWLAARCDGPHGWAHTSAVLAVVPDGPPFRSRVAPSLLAALDETGRRVDRPDVREHLDDARRFLRSGG